MNTKILTKLQAVQLWSLWRSVLVAGCRLHLERRNVDIILTNTRSSRFSIKDLVFSWLFRKFTVRQILNGEVRVVIIVLANPRAVLAMLFLFVIIEVPFVVIMA